MLLAGLESLCVGNGDGSISHLQYPIDASSGTCRASGIYLYRLPLQTQGFLNSNPQSTGEGVRYSAFTFMGYHLVTQERGEVE